jgi:sensor histidine kinase YesM
LPTTNEYATGYATYRLQVTLPDSLIGQEMAIRVNSARAASTLYVNEQEIGASGQVGRSIHQEIGKNKPYSAVTKITAKKLQIDLEVSNFHYHVGGVGGPLDIGLESAIVGLDQRNLAYDLLIIGFLLSLSVFFIGQLHYVDTYKSSIFFAFMILAMALFMSTQSEKVIYLLSPTLDYDLFNRITLSLAFIVYTLVLHYLYYALPSIVSFKLIRISTLATVVFLLFAWLVDIRIATSAYFIVFIYFILVQSYMFWSFYKAIRIRMTSILYLLIAMVTGLIYSFIAFLNFNFGYGFYDFTPIYIPILALSLGLALSEQKSSMMTKLNRSEMDKLRHQIKPHFLYNAINTIIWMNKRDAERTEHLLHDLSDFLRGSFVFEEGKQTTLFQSELDLTNAYLSLEKARFGDKLKVEWQMETTHFWLPPLILQPIVENAVRHGVMKKVEGGLVQIHVYTKKEFVVIEVSDDGPGFPAFFLQSWQSEQWHPAEQSGVGLKNVHLRLLNMYNVPLVIENQPDGGAKVTIRLRRGEIT